MNRYVCSTCGTRHGNSDDWWECCATAETQCHRCGQALEPGPYGHHYGCGDCEGGA